MKPLLLLLSITYSLSIQAVTPGPYLCTEDQFDSFLKIFQFEGAPQDLNMTIDYSLTRDCTYTVTSNLEIPNSDTLKNFMMKLIDSSVNYASADKSKISSIKLTSIGSEYKQIVSAKKSNFKAEVISNCKFTTDSSSLMSYFCKVATNDSKTKGIINAQLFEKNETTITCQSGSPKKCTFTTVGKAKGILTKSSCDLAAPGAAETFESTYRLAYYLANGNINNLQKGKALVDRFYQKAKNHNSIGKEAFVLHDKL